MATYILFFMIWGKFGTSSINVDFTTQAQCEKAKDQLYQIIPPQKDGYFKYGGCFEK